MLPPTVEDNMQSAYYRKCHREGANQQSSNEYEEDGHSPSQSSKRSIETKKPRLSPIHTKTARRSRCKVRGYGPNPSTHQGIKPGHACQSILNHHNATLCCNQCHNMPCPIMHCCWFLDIKVLQSSVSRQTVQSIRSTDRLWSIWSQSSHGMLRQCGAANAAPTSPDAARFETFWKTQSSSKLQCWPKIKSTGSIESACKALTATETGEDAPEKISRNYEKDSCNWSTTLALETDATGLAFDEKLPGGGSNTAGVGITMSFVQWGAPLCALAGCFCAHGDPSALLGIG